MSKVAVIFAFFFATLVCGRPFEGDATGKYLFSNSMLPYLHAFATCKRYGYNLATERSVADDELLKAAITKAQVTTRNHYMAGVYQSSTDFRPEWIWIDSGERFNYTHWGLSQPILSQCLLKGALSTLAGNWTTALCTSSAYFICQT